MTSGFSAYLTVLVKELRENTRDRRTLISALLFGPLVPPILLTALMLAVASYTRSYREAQTWLSVILLVPTLPIVFASVYGLNARPALIAVPSLGQHLLIQRLLRAEGFALGLWSMSAATTLVSAALLTWLVIRLWQREALLG